MTSIADDPAAELRALRERAYGPGADIHADAAALARLHELENGTRDRAEAGVVVEDATGEAAAGERESAREGAVASAGDFEALANGGFASGVALGADDATAAPTPAEAADNGNAPSTPAGSDGASPARTPWWRRRMRLLWIVSLVVAALVGAAVALSSHAIGAGQVAVLAVDHDAESPEQFFGSGTGETRTFGPFHGLSAFAVPQDFGDGTTSTCLYVTAGVPSNETGVTMMTAGCAAGSFPAVASFTVTAQAPAELRDRFEDGTALQFVLDGDHVRVYAARGASAP